MNQSVMVFVKMSGFPDRVLMTIFRSIITGLLCLPFMAMAVEDCEHAIYEARHQDALTACQQALKTHPQQALDVWLHLVDVHHVLGKQNQEQEALEQIKNHPEFPRRPDIQYEWYRKMGQQNYHMGAYLQALSAFEQGLKLAGDDPVKLSKSHNDLGLAQVKLFNQTQALHHFQQSLALKLDHGNAYQVGNTLNNIALAHMARENHQQAVSYYEQALDQYLNYTEKADYDERVIQQISHIYEDLTLAYTLSGSDEKAMEYADKILNTFALKQSPQAQARALLNIGQMHLGLHDDNQAEPFFIQAKQLLDGHQLPISNGYYLGMARIKHHQQQTAAAIELVTTGIDKAEVQQDHQALSRFYELLSELYRDQDMDASLEYLKKSKNSREVFLQEKFDLQLNNIQHQIDLQKIQHDLVNEQLDNARKSAEVQRLNYLMMLAILVILLLGVVLLLYVFRKRKERDALLQSIKHHRQQLFMMQEEQEQKTEPTQPVDREELKKKFKISLVDLMVDALACWEKSTGQDRIELAERSRAWTVSIDNGTLRTRSLDKYLELEKMPANPRWRQVVKTCHFILSGETLAGTDRQNLEQKLDQVLHQAKEMSLAASR